jgi:uncharacterized membrane protein YbhN (UPF0104 family)
VGGGDARPPRARVGIAPVAWLRSGAVPFVPGGAVGAAAMAMGLDRAGLDPAAAAAAALSFHAIETAASLLFGGAGWLQLRSRPVLGRPAEVRQAVPADAW